MDFSNINITDKGEAEGTDHRGVKMRKKAVLNYKAGQQNLAKAQGEVKGGDMHLLPARGCSTLLTYLGLALPATCKCHVHDNMNIKCCFHKFK